MSTSEIEKAIQKLEAKTLSTALKAAGKKVTPKDKKEALIKQYLDAVVEEGINGFVKKLPEADFKVFGS